MNTDLRKAIFELALEVTGLSEQNLFYKSAPQGTAGLYCVFSEITNPKGPKSSLTKTEDSYIQFSSYGENQTDLETLAGAIRSKFEGSQASFSLTNYYVLEVQWQLTRDSFSEDLNQIVVQFRFLLQAK